MRASSSFPAVFCPCRYKNHIFSDGGSLNNLPVKEVRELGAEKIITVKFEPITITPNSNFMEIILKNLDIMSIETNRKKIVDSDIVIAIPSCKEINFLNANQIDNYFKQGYEITKKVIKKIHIY